MDLRETIDKLKAQLSWNLSKEEWKKLIDSIEDTELAKSLKEIVDEMDRHQREFSKIKSDLQGKPLAEIPKDKLRELSTRSSEIRNLESKLQTELKSIEKELTERGILQEIKTTIKEGEAAIHRERDNLGRELGKAKAEAEKAKNKIKGIFQ